MTFGEAMDNILDGGGMRLEQWSPEVFIRIQHPDENSKMTASYFYADSRFGKVPWIPTQIEMFSGEWGIQ